MQLLESIVIDNGSYKCKAGIAGETPGCCFRTIVGRPQPNIMNNLNIKDAYVGNYTLDRRGVYNSCPIENGIVTNWDDMEQIWHHIFFNELQVKPEEHPCLMTEAPMNPNQNREKMTQILFETFNVPQFYVKIQAVLSLYTQGKITGLVVDSGEDVSHTVPVYEGYALPHAIQRIALAGSACTDWMVKLIAELGVSLSNSAERETVADIKEKFCYVAFDYDEEIIKFKESNYNHSQLELPDGNILVLQDQRFRCPELLFKPNLMGLELSGLHELAYKSIMKCDVNFRQGFYDSIVLSGGNTMFSGLSERLSKEITTLAPALTRINIDAPPERNLSAWMGGSILSTLSTFNDMWITRAEYDESGASIVHKKCF